MMAMVGRRFLELRRELSAQRGELGGIHEGRRGQRRQDRDAILLKAA